MLADVPNFDSIFGWLFVSVSVVLGVLIFGIPKYRDWRLRTNQRTRGFEVNDVTK